MVSDASPNPESDVPPPSSIDLGGGSIRCYVHCVIGFKHHHGDRIAGPWQDRMRQLLGEAEALYRDAPPFP